MSKAKHTAGPWVARITPWGIDIHTDDDKSFGICDLGTRSQLEDADYPFEEASANARLIAAAPEMLEILQELYNDLEVWSHIWPDQQERIEELIKSATEASNL